MPENPAVGSGTGTGRGQLRGNREAAGGETFDAPAGDTRRKVDALREADAPRATPARADAPRALTAREALVADFVSAAASDRVPSALDRCPAHAVEVVAVFEDGSAEARRGRFLGLVDPRKRLSYPLRVCGDLLLEGSGTPRAGMLPGRTPLPGTSAPGTDPSATGPSRAAAGIPSATLLSMDEPLERVEERLREAGVDALAVKGEGGDFAGVVTRESVLRALLRRERELLAQSRELHEAIEEQSRGLRERSRKWEALHGLTTSLLRILARCEDEQEFAERSIGSLTAIAGARYGAIALLDDEGEVREFAYSGMDPRVAERIGRLPTRAGLLARILHGREIHNIEDVSRDPRRRGFPPGHPRIRSLLAVPLVDGDHPIGRIYLGEKRGEKCFTRDDEQIVQGFGDSLVLALAAFRLERERHTLELQVHQAAKMEAVGRLAGGVAHDFNNLLTVMLGHAGILARGVAADAKLERSLGELSRAISRAAGLTRRLLAFCRRQPFQPRILDPNEVVAGMREMLETLAGDSIRLELHLDPGVGSVLLDRGQLEEVVMNLVVNARDASGPGAGIRITVREEPEAKPPGPAGACGSPRSWVAVEVADDGCGMSPEVRERIFEPFFTTKGDSNGTGLGLSVVHGIVSQSGGWIDVDSAPGQGTRVTVRLPRLSAVPDRETAAPGEDVPGGEESILVLDDEAAVAEVACEMLRGLGYRAEACCRGEDARARADEGAHWDLLLADVSMPGRSGPEVAGELLDRGVIPRVVFVSGNPREETESFEPGGLIAEALCDYLPKPFTEAELARKVRDALDGASLQDAGHTASGVAAAAPGRILVVDDDEQVRGFVRAVLEECGHEVVEAADGAAGLRALQEREFDTVVTDLIMPGMEGLEFCQAVRREHPRTRIVAMSGHPAGVPMLGAARRLGAGKILGKPFTRRELEEALA